MRHTQTSINKDIRDRYNSVPEYRFSIRGQVFSFQTRDEYLEAFERSLEIADRQQRWIEDGKGLEDFDVQQALEDSDYDAQLELAFDRKIENEDRFSDDVCPTSR